MLLFFFLFSWIGSCSPRESGMWGYIGLFCSRSEAPGGADRWAPGSCNDHRCNSTGNPAPYKRILSKLGINNSNTSFVVLFVNLLFQFWFYWLRVYYELLRSKVTDLLQPIVTGVNPHSEMWMYLSYLVCLAWRESVRLMLTGTYAESMQSEGSGRVRLGWTISMAPPTSSVDSAVEMGSQRQGTGRRTSS